METPSELRLVDLWALPSAFKNDTAEDGLIPSPGRRAPGAARRARRGSLDSFGPGSAWPLDLAK
jgi:hypothetical protein